MTKTEIETKLAQAAQHLKYAQKQFDDRLLIAATDEELALMTQVSSASSLLACAQFLQVIACTVATPATWSNKTDERTQQELWAAQQSELERNTRGTGGMGQ